MKITKTGDKYQVESASRKGTFYEVDLDKPFCTCPAFLFRYRPKGETCKHIDAVKEYAEKRESVVSNKNKEKMDEVLAFVEKENEVDSIQLLELFGEELVNDLIDKGFLIERNGRIFPLE